MPKYLQMGADAFGNSKSSSNKGQESALMNALAHQDRTSHPKSHTYYHHPGAHAKVNQD